MLVGLVEGLLLGIVYAVAGVPHPTLLGALSAVAAMIPFLLVILLAVIGAFMVGTGGALWTAAVVVAIGYVMVFVADHFVRPVLIGGATKLPFLWVLLGILGGVETWGLVGLFVGPAVMAAPPPARGPRRCGRRCCRPCRSPAAESGRDVAPVHPRGAAPPGPRGDARRPARA